LVAFGTQSSWDKVATTARNFIPSELFGGIRTLDLFRIIVRTVTPSWHGCSQYNKKST
jgi:hypothetical protein